MIDDQPQVVDDPTRRIVCVFASEQSAEQARKALISYGFERRQIERLDADDAGAIDTSAKWFADTDKEMKKFARELRRGYVALAVPVKDSDTRNEVNEILQDHGAKHVTHFGDWVTVVMR